VERADLEAVIMGMLDGQYQNPVRVVGFNTAEGWSKDVSADVAHEIRYRCDLQMRDVPFYLEDFVEQCEGRCRDVQLPDTLIGGCSRHEGGRVDIALQPVVPSLINAGPLSTASRDIYD